MSFVIKICVINRNMTCKSEPGKRLSMCKCIFFNLVCHATLETYVKKEIEMDIYEKDA